MLLIASLSFNKIFYRFQFPFIDLLYRIFSLHSCFSSYLKAVRKTVIFCSTIWLLISCVWVIVAGDCGLSVSSGWTAGLLKKLHVRERGVVGVWRPGWIEGGKAISCHVAGALLLVRLAFVRILYRKFPGFVLAFRAEGRQPKHGQDRGRECVISSLSVS